MRSVLRLACAVLVIGCHAAVEDDGGDDADDPVDPPDEICATGTHACGEACVPDQANMPHIGCRLGCSSACPTPANAVASCTAEGRCGFACADGYASIAGECAPASCEQLGYICGSFTDDAGTPFACGACFGTTPCGADHQCDVPADWVEPNNGVSSAHDLGDLDDADDPDRWFAALTVDSSSDEDFFAFHLVDGWDGGNPDVRVGVEQVAHALGWLDSKHELAVWFACDTADAGSIVRCGEGSTTIAENTLTDGVLGVGCRVDARYGVWAEIAPSCSGIDEHGDVTIRVRKLAPPRGDVYDLTIAVD